MTLKEYLEKVKGFYENSDDEGHVKSLIQIIEKQSEALESLELVALALPPNVLHRKARQAQEKLTRLFGVSDE